MINNYRSFFAQKGSAGAPSTLYDIEAGRPTEGDHIIGDLVRRADRLSIEVPILRAALCNLEIYGARRETAHPTEHRAIAPRQPQRSRKTARLLKGSFKKFVAWGLR
jgi:hypothetical protein